MNIRPFGLITSVRVRLRLYYNVDLVEKSSIDMWRREFEIVKSLLEEARRRLGVEYELFPFRQGDEPFIYKAHFALNEILRKAGCDAFVRGLRLHGVLAFVINGEVVWTVECLRHDYDFLRRKAIEAGSNKVSIGFLKAIIDDPSYFNRVLDEIRRIVGEYKAESKEEVIVSYISSIIGELKNAVIVLNVPLGLRSIGVKAVKTTMLVLYGVSGVKPGLYAVKGEPIDALRRLGFEVKEIDEDVLTNVRCIAIDIVEALERPPRELDIAWAFMLREVTKVEFGVNDVRAFIAYKWRFDKDVDYATKALADLLQVTLIPIHV